MASYLSTSTRRRLRLHARTPARPRSGASGEPLKLYDFIETALPAEHQDHQQHATAARQDAIIKYIADTIGAPYPFDSHGVVAGRAAAAPDYALEVQTKSHFGGGSIGIGTLAHEIAHQWFGDSVGPATWREIWFNEGWATWWAQWWSNKQNGARSRPPQSFTDNYNSTAEPTTGAPRPTALAGPGDLFDTFPVYTRPRMALEGYRQIVGDTAFFAFQKALATEYAYSTITGDQFKALATPDRGREGRLRGLQPGQARRVLAAVDLGAGQADADPDDVLPEHERAPAPSAARCRRRCR